MLKNRAMKLHHKAALYARNLLSSDGKVLRQS